MAIKLKRGTGVPTATDLVDRQLGINKTTGDVYLNNNGTIKKVNQLNRTIQTNLASTAAATDTGANITPGITGTLPIANGGTGNTTGLAASATKLATARAINGVNFDGTAAITINANPVTGYFTGQIASNTTLRLLAQVDTVGNGNGYSDLLTFDYAFNVYYTSGVGQYLGTNRSHGFAELSCGINSDVITADTVNFCSVGIKMTTTPALYVIRSKPPSSQIYDRRFQILTGIDTNNQFVDARVWNILCTQSRQPINAGMSVTLYTNNTTVVNKPTDATITQLKIKDITKLAD